MVSLVLMDNTHSQTASKLATKSKFWKPVQSNLLKPDHNTTFSQTTIYLTPTHKIFETKRQQYLKSKPHQHLQQNTLILRSELMGTRYKNTLVELLSTVNLSSKFQSSLSTRDESHCRPKRISSTTNTCTILYIVCTYHSRSIIRL